MPPASSHDSLQKRVKDTFSIILSVSVVICLALTCTLMYGFESQWAGVVGCLLLVVGLPFCYFYAFWLCRRKGLSLERQIRSPFVFEVTNTTASVAELRFSTDGQREKVLLSIGFFVVAVVFSILKSDGTFSLRWGIPLGIAVLNVSICHWSWRRAMQSSCVARADSQELLGIEPILRNPVIVRWNEIKSVTHVEEFNFFGSCKRTWLSFEDAQANTLAQIPMNIFPAEVEKHFLSVVGRYWSNSDSLLKSSPNI